MITFSDLVTRVADDANLNTTITTSSARLKREINRIGAEIWHEFPWSFRWRNYRIVTDTEVIAGTVTATNGSRTITGSGTAFSSSHADWFINFPGDAIRNWYRVRAFTSGTQLELDIPYQGSTGSGKSYQLRRFDYVLPTEIHDLESIVVTSNNSLVKIVHPIGADLSAPTPFYKSTPLVAAIYSSDSAATTYNTGTISGTINTTTLTGSGTSWLSAIYPGDEVTIGSNKYTVRQVNSDTQISLYNKQQATSSAGTAYTITRQFGRILRILWTSDQNYAIDIRGMRRYADLINDSDTNELLSRFPNMISLKVAALDLKRQNDVRAKALEQEASALVFKARSEDDALTPKSSAASIYSYRTMGRGRANEIRG